MRMYKFLEWRIPQHSLRSFVILAGKSASGGSNSPGTGCRRPVCHLLSVIHWEGNWQQTRFRDVLNQTNVCWAALLTKFFLTHSAFYLISIHNTFTAHLNLSRTGASITQSGFYFQNLPNKKKTKKNWASLPVPSVHMMEQTCHCCASSKALTGMASSFPFSAQSGWFLRIISSQPPGTGVCSWPVGWWQEQWRRSRCEITYRRWVLTAKADLWG